MSPTNVAIICLTLITIVGLRSCGSRTDSEEVKAVAEACTKVGKEPLINITPSGIKMGCGPQPASSAPR